MKPWAAVICGVLLLGSCATLKDWWSEPVSSGTTPGTVETPGGGTYTPPPAPTEPVKVETPGGGDVTYTPPASQPVVTKGDLVERTATGIAATMWGPLGGALASMLFGVAGAAMDKKKAS